MCGRYVVFTDEENQEIHDIISEINDRYKEDSIKMKTGEIFPSDTVPVITVNENNERTANLFKWGFPNYRQPGGLIINARSETVNERPAFRNLIHSGRCLVPASGFYEWKTVEKRKEKYLIRSAQSRLIYFAGLYTGCIDKKGQSYTGFVIITTEANEQMSGIHTRMPVILDPDRAASWIEAECTGTHMANSILRPYTSGLILTGC
jgi:putative SOS response-associated peptidase YedK